jgi:hypothetical protein
VVAVVGGSVVGGSVVGGSVVGGSVVGGSVVGGSVVGSWEPMLTFRRAIDTVRSPLWRTAGLSPEYQHPLCE